MTHRGSFYSPGGLVLQLSGRLKPAHLILPPELRGVVDMPERLARRLLYFARSRNEWEEGGKHKESEENGERKTRGE